MMSVPFFFVFMLFFVLLLLLTLFPSPPPPPPPSGQVSTLLSMDQTEEDEYDIRGFELTEEVAEKRNLKHPSSQLTTGPYPHYLSAQKTSQLFRLPHDWQRLRRERLRGVGRDHHCELPAIWHFHGQHLSFRQLAPPVSLAMDKGAQIRSGLACFCLLLLHKGTLGAPHGDLPRWRCALQSNCAQTACDLSRIERGCI